MTRWLSLLCLPLGCIVVVCCGASPVGAQVEFRPFAPNPFPRPLLLGSPRTVDLAGELQIDQIDNTTRGHLERAQAFLRSQQPEDAMETYLRLMEEQGDKLAGWTTAQEAKYQRFVPLRQVVMRQLAHAASHDPAVLQSYRRIVDPLADRWLAEGKYEAICEELFLSRAGDHALDQLGQRVLREGKYAAARSAWQRLANFDSAEDSNSPNNDTVVAYPDSDIPREIILSRLVLTSILEGDRIRARRELDEFSEMFPLAEGTIGGQTGKLVVLLQQLWEASENWSELQVAGDWPTFAGNVQRNGVAAPLNDPLSLPLWQKTLRSTYTRSSLDDSAEQLSGYPAVRPGEHQRVSLPYCPIVVDGTVFVSEGTRLRAFGLVDGASRSPVSDEGELYPLADTLETEDLHPGRLGTPRFPISVDGPYLAACLGSPVTVLSTQVVTRRASQQLVVMDWKSQRVAMLLPVPSDTWTFESGPLVHRGHVYVAMRQSGVQSECHVACFEIVSQRMVWRTLICAGVSLGGGELQEITHNLLTLHDDMVFANTSLGAVAALDRSSGKIRWLVEYPRQGTAEASVAQPAWHVLRDLTPCLYDRGMLYVAPPDCAQMFCLDAFSGGLLWETDFPAGVFDGTHLIAVQGDQLLVAGRRLWWLDRQTGRLSRQVAANPFPAGPRAEPPGAGRPVVAGQTIYWPVAGETDEIYVLDFSLGRMIRQPIRMPDGLRLGNLCAAHGVLLVANESQLYALDGRPTPSSEIAR